MPAVPCDQAAPNCLWLIAKFRHAQNATCFMGCKGSRVRIPPSRPKIRREIKDLEAKASKSFFLSDVEKALRGPPRKRCLAEGRQEMRRASGTHPYLDASRAATNTWPRPPAASARVTPGVVHEQLLAGSVLLAHGALERPGVALVVLPNATERAQADPERELRSLFQRTVNAVLLAGPAPLSKWPQYSPA
jgi:hypothetical protein